jgi:hypothetical protein
MSLFPHVLAAGLALSACSALVPSTAARLALLDPLTADPAGVGLVVILPPGLAITPGSAILELQAVRGTEALRGSFQLTDRALPSSEGLPQGTTARGFAVREADIPRMRALQAKIADWKRAGAAKGSLGLGIGGCAVGAGPAPDAMGSVLIRLSAEDPYLPLIQDGSLAELLGPDTLAAIKPCQGAE